MMMRIDLDFLCIFKFQSFPITQISSQQIITGNLNHLVQWSMLILREKMKSARLSREQPSETTTHIIISFPNIILFYGCFLTHTHAEVFMSIQKLNYNLFLHCCLRTGRCTLDSVWIKDLWSDIKRKKIGK